MSLFGRRKQAEQARDLWAAVAPGRYFLTKDDEGLVHGVWFEDDADGTAVATNPWLLEALLEREGLQELLGRGFQGGPDYAGGGYMISFTARARQVERAPAPVQETASHLAPGSDLSTPHVDDALDALFSGVVLAIPVSVDAELQRQYDDLVEAWSSRALSLGTPEQTAGVLRANLERDARQPGFNTFMLRVMDEETCVQMHSMYHPGAVLYGRHYEFPTARGYRVWRTSEALGLCGPGDAILQA